MSLSLSRVLFFGAVFYFGPLDNVFAYQGWGVERAKGMGARYTLESQDTSVSSTRASNATPGSSEEMVSGGDLCFNASGFLDVLHGER